MATSLPFERKSGGLASPGEIATEWHNVKARADLALKGAGSFRAITALKLSQKMKKKRLKKLKKPNIIPKKLKRLGLSQKLDLY
jgi:hypothetical protein